MSSGAQVNGPTSPTGKYIDTIDPEDPEYIRNLQRPAEVKEDMKQMEGRSRVSVVLNSQAFREELESLVQEQLRQGGPASLYALQQITDLLLPQSRGIGASFGRSSPVIPINDIRGVETLGYSKQEKVLRCKLAALYRLIDMFGWTHGIYNHISLRVSQEQEQFLVNPFGMLYAEVTASTLMKVDVRGEVMDSGSTGLAISKAGFTLHSAIHQARPDIKCVIHLHTPAAVAVSATKQGLLPLSQEALLCGKVSYHDYHGILVDQDERDLLARNLGPFNKVMLLRNHGVVACGETVEEAFHYAFNLMAACETQMTAMSVGIDNLILVDEATQEKAFKVGSQGGGGVDSSGRKWKCGELEWEALMRTLDNAGYRTGHVYKQPLMKQEKKERTNSDVEVPPASSSFTYIFDGDYEHSKYVSPIKMAMERQKQAYKAGWLTSPNAYKKTEIEEIGTTTPKKITKWVPESESQGKSMAMKVSNPNQFAPQGSNPKEFREKQKSFRKDYYEEKVTPGPQSKILEGLSWEEAARLKEAGDQTVIVGAASKGIIQRDHQHNAVVYRSYYAANPFENMSEEEVNAYKSEVARKGQREDADDEPAPDGRLISTEERMQNIQHSREDINPDTEVHQRGTNYRKFNAAIPTQETNTELVVKVEKVESQPEAKPEPPKELWGPSDFDPDQQRLEGIGRLVDVVVQAVLALAGPDSLIMGWQSPGGEGSKGMEASGHTLPLPPSSPTHESLLPDVTAPSGSATLTPDPLVQSTSGSSAVENSDLEATVKKAFATEKLFARVDNDKTPDVMSVHLEPLTLFQGKPSNGVVKISFTIKSKVRRRKKSDKDWPIDNVTITQSQPTVTIVHPKDSKTLTSVHPKDHKKVTLTHSKKVLQEQQNLLSPLLVPANPPQPMKKKPQVGKLSLGGILPHPSVHAGHSQHFTRRSHGLGKRQGTGKLSRLRKKLHWTRRGHPGLLSPVNEEHVEGDDTLEALLASQNVDISSDESLEELLLMTENYKENLAPCWQSSSVPVVPDDIGAPLATLDDFEESGSHFSMSSASQMQHDEMQLCTACVVDPHFAPSVLQVSELTSEKFEDILQTECSLNVEEISHTLPEASDGDIAPRKQDDFFPAMKQQVMNKRTEDTDREILHEELRVDVTHLPYADDQISPVASSDLVTVASADMSTCESSARIKQECEVSKICEKPAEKTTLYRSDSASLEASPVVSGPLYSTNHLSDPIHRELHRVRSVGNELDETIGPVKKAETRSHPVLRRVQSTGCAISEFRNVAVIDAVLHTVTIDPAKLRQPVSSYLSSSQSSGAGNGDKKRWTLLDTVTKSLQALDTDDLTKQGAKIFGRSLEIRIHDKNALPEDLANDLKSATAKTLSVEEIFENLDKSEQPSGPGSKVYKDDVVIITKANNPLEFSPAKGKSLSSISEQAKKDLFDAEEGPLVTSSPKTGRRNSEGSFKKYQSGMGKSEETLLEVAPLSPEESHKTARRSKSFPKNFGLPRNWSDNLLVANDGQHTDRYSYDQNRRNSTQSMSTLDPGARQRNKQRNQSLKALSENSPHPFHANSESRLSSPQRDRQKSREKQSDYETFQRESIRSRVSSTDSPSARQKGRRFFRKSSQDLADVGMVEGRDQQRQKLRREDRHSSEEIMKDVDTTGRSSGSEGIKRRQVRQEEEHFKVHRWLLHQQLSDAPTGNQTRRRRQRLRESDDELSAGDPNNMLAIAEENIDGGRDGRPKRLQTLKSERRNSRQGLEKEGSEDPDSINKVQASAVGRQLYQKENEGKVEENKANRDIDDNMARNSRRQSRQGLEDEDRERDCVTRDHDKGRRGRRPSRQSREKSEDEAQPNEEKKANREIDKDMARNSRRQSRQGLEDEDRQRDGITHDHDKGRRGRRPSRQSRENSEDKAQPNEEKKANREIDKDMARNSRRQSRQGLEEEDRQRERDSVTHHQDKGRRPSRQFREISKDEAQPNKEMKANREIDKDMARNSRRQGRQGLADEDRERDGVTHDHDKGRRGRRPSRQSRANSEDEAQPNEEKKANREIDKDMARNSRRQSRQGLADEDRERDGVTHDHDKGRRGRRPSRQSRESSEDEAQPIEEKKANREIGKDMARNSRRQSRQGLEDEDRQKERDSLTIDNDKGKRGRRQSRQLRENNEKKRELSDQEKRDNCDIYMPRNVRRQSMQKLNDLDIGRKMASTESLENVIRNDRQEDTVRERSCDKETESDRPRRQSRRKRETVDSENNSSHVNKGQDRFKREADSENTERIDKETDYCREREMRSKRDRESSATNQSSSRLAGRRSSREWDKRESDVQKRDKERLDRKVPENERQDRARRLESDDREQRTKEKKGEEKSDCHDSDSGKIRTEQTSSDCYRFGGQQGQRSRRRSKQKSVKEEYFVTEKTLTGTKSSKKSYDRKEVEYDLRKSTSSVEMQVSEKQYLERQPDSDKQFHERQQDDQKRDSYKSENSESITNEQYNERRNWPAGKKDLPSAEMEKSSSERKPKPDSCRRKEENETLVINTVASSDNEVDKNSQSSEENIFQQADNKHEGEKHHTEDRVREISSEREEPLFQEPKSAKGVDDTSVDERHENCEISGELPLPTISAADESHSEGSPAEEFPPPPDFLTQQDILLEPEDSDYHTHQIKPSNVLQKEESLSNEEEEDEERRPPRVIRPKSDYDTNLIKHVREPAQANQGSSSTSTTQKPDLRQEEDMEATGRVTTFESREESDLKCGESIVAGNLDIITYSDEDEPPHVRRSYYQHSVSWDKVDKCQENKAGEVSENRHRSTADSKGKMYNSYSSKSAEKLARENMAYREAENGLTAQQPSTSLNCRVLRGDDLVGASKGMDTVANDLDIIKFDEEQPNLRRAFSQQEKNASNSGREGRIRGRREKGERRPLSGLWSKGLHLFEKKPSIAPPEIRIQAASQDSLDRDCQAPPLPPKQRQSMEQLSELKQGSREYSRANSEQPPELPPKKGKKKTFSCVGSTDVAVPEKKHEHKHKKGKETIPLSEQVMSSEACDSYSEEPHQLVPGEDSHVGGHSFDNDDAEDGYPQSKRKQFSPNNSAFWDETVSLPRTPKPARKISTGSNGEFITRTVRSVSFNDDLSPPMFHRPQRHASRESLHSEASTNYGRMRSYSGASEASMVSNPLLYEPWRARAGAQQHSLHPHHSHHSHHHLKPHSSKSHSELTYSANGGRRHRSRTPNSGRMYQPRRSRSRSSLPDAPSRPSAPLNKSRDSSTMLAADESFSDVFNHGYASEVIQQPVRRTESMKQPEKNPELIKELERKGIGRSKSDRRQRGEGDAEKPGSPAKSDPMDSASGGETLEERSSKEGSPTKEAPHSPTKEKKKKKKFRMPSFSKTKKKDNKESAI